MAQETSVLCSLECIGANRPETPGTVPDLERLSHVPRGNENLSQLFWSFMIT